MRSASRSSGFTLIEILVTTAVMMIAFGVIITTVEAHRREVKRIAFISQLQSLREAAVAAIANQTAWQNTRNGNRTLMDCMTKFPATCGVPVPNAPAANFNLYDGTGKILINSNAPTSGFDEYGKPCGNYLASGSRDCPVRVRTTWNIVCSGADGCKYPEEYVSVLFDYSPPPGTGYVVNLNRINLKAFSRTNLLDNQSPTVTCATRNLIFVGFGKTVLNGQRQPTNADVDGCVPLQAFKGPVGFRGFMGPMGPRGPRGPIGPMGPPGNTTPAPLPEPEPIDPQVAICNSYGQICALYSQYFGRFPDAAGAAFWASQLAGGQSLESIEANFQVVASGGQYVTTGFDRPTLWNDISASLGLPSGPVGDAPCSGDVTCMQINAAATNQFNAAINSYCDANPGSCYIKYGSP